MKNDSYYEQLLLKNITLDFDSIFINPIQEEIIRKGY